MKKLGLLLCMLLGLAACGREPVKKAQIYPTLEEAFQVEETQYHKAFVTYTEMEGQYIAAFVEHRPTEEIDAYGVGFAIYEKVEDGFVLRDHAASYSLQESSSWSMISGEMDWTEKDGTCILYELKGQGLGYGEPTAEELQELDFPGEVFKKDGFYFALHLNAYRGTMPVK